MAIRRNFVFITTVICLLALICPLQALSDDNSVDVIYQNSFASDPHWTTNNPSTNYWDPNVLMYHFSIEPSTGAYVYTNVDYERGSFTLDYDVIITSIDDGATFRFGLSGSEMDLNQAPNVLTQFTNGKFGMIMWLHLVTPGSKLMEVNSQTGDTVTSGPSAYSGPTVKYELNKTYHVTVNYDNDYKTLSMNVDEKITGKKIWSYFLNTAEQLSGMNRLFLGSKGDYGMMNRYAVGYIDNVRLTAPAVVTTTKTGTIPLTTAATIPTTKVTPKQTTVVPTPAPSDTPASPSAGVLAISALCITGLLCTLVRKKKD
ncbi:MAG TPA: hypothetical protein VMV55_04970 [Methanoregula sp.]|nr:hypothetical protein [Methanoregula sp.]